MPKSRKTTSRGQPPSGDTDREGLSVIRWLPIFIAFATAVPFIPVLQNDFVDWDDHANYLANTAFRGLSLENLRWMFTTFHLSLYRPVTWMTLGFDYLVWGMNPTGYHLTSLLIHCANAVLLYFLALRVLRLAMPAANIAEHWRHASAGLAALAFSLHPLRVEPVAWASARNDLVAAFFFIAMLLCYLRATAAVRPLDYRRWIVGAMALYALSLLAKASAMALPIVLVALDFYLLKRFGTGSKFRRETRRLWYEKVPFFLLAVGAGVLAVAAKQQSQAIQALDKYTWAARLAESFSGLTFYLWKTLVPVHLSPLYELPVEPNPLAISYLLSGFFVVALTGFVFLKRRRWPAGLLSWIFYVAMLLPVLGIVQFGRQAAADRYSYLSCLGWAISVGAAAWYGAQLRAAGQLGARGLALGKTAAIAALIFFSILTWQQSRIWHDSASLWRHALVVDPQSSFAHHMRALALHNQGKTREAIEHYRKSAQLDPNFVQAHYNLAGFLAKQGNFREAAFHYRRAIEIDPNGPSVAYYDLANALARQGLFDDAIKYYRLGLQKDPNDASAYNDLGNVFAAKGDRENALRYYQRAAELDPKLSGPLFNIGGLLAHHGRLDEAIEYFERAVGVSPDSAQAQNMLGKVLASRGRLDEAVRRFRTALRIEPGFAEAHENLALALREQNKKH